MKNDMLWFVVNVLSDLNCLIDADVYYTILAQDFPIETSKAVPTAMDGESKFPQFFIVRSGSLLR